MSVIIYLGGVTVNEIFTFHRTPPVDVYINKTCRYVFATIPSNDRELCSSNLTLQLLNQQDILRGKSVVVGRLEISKI